MKEIGDCVGLRKRIQEAFELAAMPGTREEDIQRVLHFVVVGGGPTGRRRPGGGPAPQEPHNHPDCSCQ